MVAYRSPFGQCYRTYCLPRDPQTEAQLRMRAILGSSSQGWGLELTEPQRQRWALGAQNAPSHPSLGQYSHLSGQQFCVKINSTLRCISKPPVQEPPAPVAFSPNPVGDLVIPNDEQDGVRLLLNVGTVTEEIMVFGQAPCSAGRMKQRRVVYLGLAGAATNGQCDITDLYTARFGEPRPGQKVFVVTCQEKDGWKAQDHVTSAIVPPKSPLAENAGNQEAKAEIAAKTEAPEAQSAPVQGSSSLSRAVYKGSTPEARGLHKWLEHVHPLSILGTPLVHDVRIALARLAGLGMFPVRA
jgi:hypothetical protein